MSTNKFAAICTRCKTAVPAQEGRLTKGEDGWEVTHLDECEEAVRIVTDQNRWSVGDVFESEKFGVIVALASEALPNYDDDDYMTQWETFFRAANAEELEDFAGRKAHGAKVKEAEALMEGLTPTDALDEGRDAEHLVLQRGDGYNASFYASIPADHSLPIIIHSFHGAYHDAVAFKEVEYTDAAVEILRWQVEEAMK